MGSAALADNLEAEQEELFRQMIHDKAFECVWEIPLKEDGMLGSTEDVKMKRWEDG